MPHLSPLTSHLSPRPAAWLHNPALSIWLSVDPLSDKYPNLSPYTYCANNPVKLVDVDGREIYLLFYTEDAKCFKASAETRKYNIEHSESFDPQKDKVFLFSISDLADVQSKVSQTIENYGEQYGRTAEFGIWSHAGFDGPRGSSPTSGTYSKSVTQMSLAGWGQIDFNWRKTGATATFYGCRTAVDNDPNESFAQQVSRLSNFYNVEVCGQQSWAYPSTSAHWRDINAYHTMGIFSSQSTYMVGGRRHSGILAVFGGDYAYQLLCFKNGIRQVPRFQPSR